MALLRRIADALYAFSGPDQRKDSGSQQAWGAFFTTGLDQFASLFGSTALNIPFAQHPTVHAAVSAISTGISGLPMEMYPAGASENDEGELSPIRNSMVLELLENPNDTLDGPQLIEGTVDYMKLDGDAFWLLDGIARRTAMGPQFPKRIELWEPKKVRAIMEGRSVAFWEYRDGTYTVKAPAANVIQFKQFNPYDRIRGLSTLSAAMIAARGGYKALAFQEAFFDNGAVPYGLLSAKEGQIVQPESMERVRQQFEERHGGGAMKGRRLGAIDGAISYTELGMSHKDMDFPIWLDASSAFILMVFKVPPSIAGLQKDANYNESVHQSKRFWYNHMPLVNYLEKRITNRLCKAFSVPEQLCFKTEMIKALTEDQLQLSEQAHNLFRMGVTVEEINERLELGLDTSGHIAYQTPWQPYSMVNADDQAVVSAQGEIPGTTRPTKPGDYTEPSTTPPAAPSGNPGDGSLANTPTTGKGLRLVKNSEFHRALNWRTLIDMVRTEEKSYESRIRGHFGSLEKEVMFKIRKHQKDEAPLVISIDDAMFDQKKSAKQVRDLTDPIYKGAMVKGYESIVRELQFDIAFDFLAPEVQSFLHEKHMEIADLVDGPAADRLRASLEEGIQNGESVQKMTARVEEVFGVERNRAARIARTEVAEAFNGGRYETMKEADVQRIEWLTARDDRVRDSHAELDGETIAMGDRFSNGLQYPLDPAGPPEEIVNCRCVSLPAA